MWKWLLQPPPPTFGGKAKLVIGVVFANIVWSLSMAFLLGTVMGSGYYGAGHMQEVYDPLMRLGPWIFLFLVFSVTFEEMVRLVPVMLTVRISHGRRTPVLIATFLTAVGFGLLHLSNGLPLASVLLCQGVGGLSFNLLYLKFGGVRRFSVTGFAAAYAGHYLFDATLFASALLIAGLRP